MTRYELLRQLKNAARAAGTELVLVRQGGSHTIYRYGSRRIPIPRHREINEALAKSILRGVAND